MTARGPRAHDLSGGKDVGTAPSQAVPIEGVDRAAAALRQGAVVAIPTDTVYGLVVSAQRPGAAGALGAAKGRGHVVPVQVLVAGADQVAALAGAAGLGPVGERLAARFWPGGLTLVVQRRPGLALDLGGDGATIGVRCPAHPVAVELCRTVGPLAATSANHHGEAPLTDAAAVAETFAGLVAVVVDGGVGGSVASTVVDLTGDRPVLLRPGSVGWEDIEAELT